MTQLLFANNAQSTLAGPITNTATTLNVAAGTGVLFPNPTSGQAFKLTLQAAADPSVREILLVTGVSTDTFTVVRGQEGTEAVSWLAGDNCANLNTAGSMASFAQSATLATSIYEGTDNSSSSPNAVNVPTFTPAISSPAAGQLYLITKSGVSNTGGVTIQNNGGTSYACLYKDGSGLNAGDWPANSAALVYFNGSVYQYLANQANINSVITAQPSISPPRNLTTISTVTAGVTRTTSFTVPPGVTWIYVTVVGGGGGGGGGGTSAALKSMGGGGAGGTALSWIAVTPGQVFTVIVGAGGAGGAGCAGGNTYGSAGSTGATSSFGSSIYATGGGGGEAGDPSSPNDGNCAGGAPGLGYNGQENLYGGVGGDGNVTYVNVQGGPGGGSSLGGGGRTSTIYGSGIPNGLAPGSGGGGIYEASPTGAQQGGNGADGVVLVAY